MLFNDVGPFRPAPVLAISQPAHALVSGQILRAWAEPLPRDVVLAAEQHDVAWLDWEVAPSFDPATGRPHLFRAIGASLHAPMWERGVDRALAAWGRHVALLISRHGSTIYERFSDRHRSVGDGARVDDDRAAQDYIRRHRALRRHWAVALGLDNDAVERQADLLAFADTVSLVLCGALPAPSQIAVGGRTLEMTAVTGEPDTYSMHPWPFSEPEITFATEARPLPASGRFGDADAMRTWLEDPLRCVAHARLRQ